MPDFKAILTGPTDKLDNSGNRDWWEKNPMVYDWDRNLGEVSTTPEYFEGIDKIFGEGHRLCNNPAWPKGRLLENFIPYDKLQGKNVLEIGCGAGLLASQLARAGADLTAIDLTEQAIALTTRRFEVCGLRADIRRMDAEKMTFEDASFDYVVSWGVIHHSGNMAAILQHIHRVLRPGGQAFLMIYNRHSLRYQVYCGLWLGVGRLRLLKESLETINGSITDGYIARHMTGNEFLEMARPFRDGKITFSDEENTTLAYLLGPLRRLLPRSWKKTRKFERWLAQKWGWYLEAVLTK
jgi:cyclopropane fatty-acyl-phospholipid synthase-like methyltransferase